MSLNSVYLNIIFLILAAFFLSLGWPAKNFAPWVPCRSKDLKRIFKLANLKAGEVFYDLGCGDGKTVFYASEHFQAKAMGVEIAIPMFLTCKIRQFFKRTANVEFRCCDLFKEDISRADVIYVWGMPDKLKNRFRQKILKEIKPGARLISYVFAIEGLDPRAVDKPGPKDPAIYLYQF